jgi:hypothetical protein
VMIYFELSLRSLWMIEVYQHPWLESAGVTDGDGYEL